MTEFIRTLFVSGAGDTALWAPFILRLGLGLGLITHGYPKLFKTFGQFSGYVASLKWPAPKLFAALAGLIEFIGPLLLIVGLFTKGAALITALYFILMIFSAHKGQKFQGGWELSYLYLIGVLGLWAMNDSGVWALDSFLFAR